MKITYVGYNGLKNGLVINNRSSKAGYKLEINFLSSLSRLNDSIQINEYRISDKIIKSIFRNLKFTIFFSSLFETIKISIFICKEYFSKESKIFIFYNNSYLYAIPLFLKSFAIKKASFVCLVADAPQYFINEKLGLKSNLIQKLEFISYKKFDMFFTMVKDNVSDICPSKPFTQFNFGYNKKILNFFDNFPINNTHNNSINIVYAGALENYYGIKILYDVAKALPLNYHLEIYGRGSLSDEILYMSSKISNLFFYGDVSDDELIHAYSKSNILLLLIATPILHKYNYPTKIIDYLSTYRPIISNGFPSMSKELKSLLNIVELDYLAIVKSILSLSNSHIDINSRRVKVKDLLQRQHEWDIEMKKIIAEFAIKQND